MPQFKVKEEKHDEDISIGRIAEKPRRVLFRAVELPTWETVKNEKYGIKKQEDIKNEFIAKIKNLKVKVKPGLELSRDTLFERVKRIGAEVYDIPFSQETQHIRDVAFPRDFISSVYGGNQQETFPRIGRQFLDQHGLDDFMFPSLDYNPEAPQVPGAPGLFFACKDRDAGEWPKVQRVITRIASASWLYMGQYRMIPSESLTKEEWIAQSEKFHNTWAREICIKGWGDWVRIRIAARQRFRCRHPTPQQLQIVNNSEEYKNVAPEQIKMAYFTGEEFLAIWGMKCIGYDVDFQQNLYERFATWSRPQRKQKKSKKTKEGIKANISNKRKRRDISSSDSDGSTVLILSDDSE